LEQYVLRHGTMFCVIRKPYAMVACDIGDITGYGFSKWNPNDAGISKWNWQEPHGVDIALGRAVLDVIRQMDAPCLASCLEVALLEQNK
jgi:hypothetical protein